MAAGDQITVTRFNNLRNRIETILGTGSTDSGYGQTLPSGIASTVSSGATITANNHGRGASGVPATTGGLLEGVERIKRHQTNTGVTVTLPEPAQGTSILNSLYDSLESEMSTLETSPNRFRISTDASQSSNTEVRADTIPANWNTVRTHTVTVTFANADAARYFFNAGSEIRFSFQVNYSSGGTVDGTKDGRWKNLIDRRVASGLLSVNFGYTGTSANTGSPATSTGWYDLTAGAAATQIFSRVDTGTYSGNDINITAAKNAGSTALTFVISFNDDGSFGATPPGDEQVTSTFTSYVNSFRATGNYVQVNQPTFAGTVV
jgi:hypothetical protein